MGSEQRAFWDESITVTASRRVVARCAGLALLAVTLSGHEALAAGNIDQSEPLGVSAAAPPELSEPVTAAPAPSPETQTAPNLNEAIVHLRSTSEDSSEATEGCTATHIGDGWLLFARHCLRPDFQQTGITPYDTVYDMTTQTTGRQLTAWSGDNFDELSNLGIADSIVLNGREAEGDIALVHVPGAERLPAVPLASLPPSPDETFRLVGFPEAHGYDKSEVALTYLTTRSAHDIGDSSLGDIPVYIFSAASDPEQPETAVCGFGYSGAAAFRDQEIVGILSRYSMADTDDGIWESMDYFGVKIPEGHNTLCVFMPINMGSIAQLQEAEGLQPSESAGYVSE